MERDVLHIHLLLSHLVLSYFIFYWRIKTASGNLLYATGSPKMCSLTVYPFLSEQGFEFLPPLCHNKGHTFK